MSIRRYFSLFLILSAVLVLASCQSAGNQSSSEPAQENRVDSGQPTEASGPFQAVATSAISVDLSWDAIEGATGYRIENSFADSEWFAIAQVGGDATSYEDFLTPSNMDLNYRLTPLMGDQDGKALNLTVTTPEVIPNSFRVVAVREEPDSSSIDLEIPGFDTSTFDPSTFDPSTLDFSGVDTENLDLSSLAPEPVSTHGRIGPAGGSLSVTGKNGIIYTLDVPPDALDFTLYFTLTPVAEIDGYPFSGGYLGAVDIQPEGIIFDTPVMLTITFPEVLIAAQPTDPEIVQMAFAYERGGEEFHLTPLAPDSVAAAQNTPDGAGKVASPNVKGPTLILNIPASRTQAMGGGNAKPREMRNHASNHATTDEANRTDQNSAAKQVEDILAPLVDDDLANLVDAENAIKDAEHQKAMRRGAEIVEKMKKATDIQKLTIALVSFQGFFDTSEYSRLLPEEQEYMFDTAAVLLKNWLQPEKCPSPEAALIQAWTRRLAKPVSGFDQKLKKHMDENYGAVAVNELLRDISSVQSCKVKLVLKSTVIMSDKEHICRYRVKVTAEVPLSWKNFGSGEAFLQGGPPEKVFNLKYTLPFDFYYAQKVDQDRCSLVEVGGLDKSEFIVLRLAPRFNRVTQAGESAHPDWGPLRYKVGGDADKLTMTFESWGFDNGSYAEYHTETRPIPNLGGDRDMWGGSMALMATKGTGGWIGDHDWVLSDAGQGGQIAHWSGKGAYVDIANNHEHDTTLSLEPQ